MILIKEFEFDAAHNLVHYHGKCEKLHGHTYKLIVKLEGEVDPEGMVYDFVELKRIVKDRVIDKFDHAYLNEIIPQPTAENISVFVWNELRDLLKRDNCRLYEVEVWETKTSGIVYRGNKMKDVQKEKDLRNIPLKNVGVRNLKWPVTLKEKKGGIQQTVATVSMSVDLPHDIRGTHMSRFVEAVNNMKSINPKDLEVMLETLRERLEAKVSHCKIQFDYFIKKPAPVSGIISPFDVSCCYEAERGEDNNFRFLMEVKVPVSTLCPCSKEISDFGAHNQRAIVTIKVDSTKLIWIEDIVKIAEDSASSPIYSLLKRTDEKYVTEQAYLNPRFVEDVAREAAVVLEENSNIRWYSVMVDSIESIHNHDAFAYTEKGVLK